MYLYPYVYVHRGKGAFTYMKLFKLSLNRAFLVVLLYKSTYAIIIFDVIYILKMVDSERECFPLSFNVH